MQNSGTRSGRLFTNEAKIESMPFLHEKREKVTRIGLEQLLFRSIADTILKGGPQALKIKKRERGVCAPFPALVLNRCYSIGTITRNCLPVSLGIVVPDGLSS